MHTNHHLLRTGIAVVAFAATAGGCTYNEDLPEVDLQGKVRIPKEATLITLVDSEGQETTLTEPDVRAIGPVYLGVFPSVVEGLYDYPHPEMGPVLQEGTPGDTYPYGGTSVGRFAWGCYQGLVCKIVTGRYENYDQIIEWFDTVVNDPIRNPDGEPVRNGAEYRERCFDANYYTSDDEVDFVGPLDFQEDGDYYVANVTILHVHFHEGAVVWGWVDMPSATFDFASCDPTGGETYTRYSESYAEGASQTDLLNHPGLYIDPGDWVSSDPPVLGTRDEVDDSATDFEIELGYHHE